MTIYRRLADYDLQPLVFPFEISDYLVASTLQREIAFDLENQGITGKSLKTEVDDVIATSPFSEHTHQVPDTLSGGEKQLLSIFAALQQPYNLYIGQHCFDFVSEQNQALIREHLIGRDKRILDITYHAGASSQYFWDPKTDLLILRESDKMQILQPDWPSSMKPWSLTAHGVHKDFENSGFSLKVQNLVLDEVHCLGIFGENGSGKTTFADCLTGLATCDGKLSIHIPDIDTPRFGYLIQHTLTQTHGLSPEDILLRFVSQSKLNESQAEELLSLLRRSNYYSSLAEMDAQLGYRMILMAALLAGQYDIVVLDEPTYGLPSTLVAQLLTTLVDELGAKPLAFISHDRNFTSLFCNRAIQMKNGSAYEASLR
jgi:energy-coupling factor transporter ATP-binding protein EcfA2